MESIQSDNKENLKSIQSNYVTVIPVDYNRSRMYTNQNPDYLMEQYRNNENFQQNEELSASQGALYSVSQRISNLSTSYSSLCTNEAGFNNNEQNNYGNNKNEWDNEKINTMDNCKDTQSELSDDKNTNDSTTSTSILNSTILSSTNNSEQSQECIYKICVYLHNKTAIIIELENILNITSKILCQAIIGCDELGLNKQLANQAFTLWMTSPLLELQLKAAQKPYKIYKNWFGLLQLYSHASYHRQQRDEPKLSFQRNVFFPQYLEEKIKDQKIIELLYEEAKNNILEGRYPCEESHYVMLGGIQARLELGCYNPQTHSIHYFREEQAKYLPMHVRKSATWTWFPISSKNSAEVRLLEQFKRIPNSATNRKLMRKYLEFCWSLPFYGSAFFEGQIEQPVRGPMSLMTHQDIPVLVAINSKGIHIIDDVQCSVLLGLNYNEFNWEFAKPSKEDNASCLPCLFIQFMIVENGARVLKILQVFSKQANLMDTLISNLVAQIKSKSSDENDKCFEHQLNHENDPHSTLYFGTINHSNNSLSTCNKLSKLTMATFDEDGHCIGQMGSWSFSY